jgi:hypothetical protein
MTWRRCPNLITKWEEKNKICNLIFVEPKREREEDHRVHVVD